MRPVKAQTTKSFEIPLEELGYEDRVLRGPLEQVRYYFGLPANWKPQEGGYLALNLDYNDSGQESHAPALLKVRLNGKISYTPHCVDFCQISGQRREVLSNG